MVNNRQMLQALIEGKKIRSPHWNRGDFIYMERNILIDQDGDQCGFHIRFFANDNWEIADYIDGMKIMKIEIHSLERRSSHD
jgi:hypothetical protein